MREPGPSVGLLLGCAEPADHTGSVRYRVERTGDRVRCISVFRASTVERALPRSGGLETAAEIHFGCAIESTIRIDVVGVLPPVVSLSNPGSIRRPVRSL